MTRRRGGESCARPPRQQFRHPPRCASHAPSGGRCVDTGWFDTTTCCPTRTSGSSGTYVHTTSCCSAGAGLPVLCCAALRMRAASPGRPLRLWLACSVTARGCGSRALTPPCSAPPPPTQVRVRTWFSQPARKHRRREGVPRVLLPCRRRLGGLCAAPVFNPRP